MTKFDTRMLTVGKDMVMNYDESELGQLVRKQSIEKRFLRSIMLLN